MTKLLCVNDTYDPDTAVYATLGDFLAMCGACHGERPVLVAHGDGTLTDASGATVLIPCTIALEAVDSGMGDVWVRGPALLEPFADAGFIVRVSDLENDWRSLQGVLPDALLTDALYERILAKGYYGELQDHQTGEGIRSATPTELRDSIEAATLDGGAGVIVIDGRRCFVA